MVQPAEAHWRCEALLAGDQGCGGKALTGVGACVDCYHGWEVVHDGAGVAHLRSHGQGEFCWEGLGGCEGGGGKRGKAGREEDGDCELHRAGRFVGRMVM